MRRTNNRHLKVILNDTSLLSHIRDEDLSTKKKSVDCDLFDRKVVFRIGKLEEKKNWLGNRDMSESHESKNESVLEVEELLKMVVDKLSDKTEN